MPQRHAPRPSDLDAMSELFEAALAEQERTAAPKTSPDAAAPKTKQSDRTETATRASTRSVEEPAMTPRSALVNWAIYILGGMLITGLGVYLLAPEETMRLLSDPSALLERLDALWRAVVEVILP